jgi:hypothetical protein
MSGGRGKDYFNCGLGEDKTVEYNEEEGDFKSHNCES